MESTTTILWNSWLLRRDQDAFARLVRPVIPHALAAAGRAGPAADAEDVVQDCLVELARERSRRPAEIGIRAWLVRAATLKARTMTRSARTRHRRESEAPVREDTPASDSRAEIREEVEGALAELPDRDREAVLLRHFHDLEYAEVARILGTSIGAARVCVHRAIARLRKRLGPSAVALLTTLTLPAARSEAALIGSAIAKAAAEPALGTALLGGVAMKISTKAVLATALLAAATGGAIVLSGAGSGGQSDDPTPEIARVQDLEEQNAALEREVGKLRTELAAAKKEAAASEMAPMTEETAVPAAANRLAVDFTKTDWDRYKALGERWRRDVTQIHDGPLRTATCREIIDALYESDLVRVHAALSMLRYLQDFEFDRLRAQERALGLLDSPNRYLRSGAVWSIAYLAPTPQAIERVLLSMKDPEEIVWHAALQAIPRLVDGRVEGNVAEALIEALGNSDPDVLGTTLVALLTTTCISPELEARLIELASSEHRQVSIRAVQALGGVAEKTQENVDALLAIAGSDRDSSSAAMDALRVRVPEDLRDRVADGTVEILGQRDLSAHMRSMCLITLGLQGSERHIRAISAFAANELATKTDRTYADAAIQSIRKRMGEPR